MICVRRRPSAVSPSVVAALLDFGAPADSLMDLLLEQLPHIRPRARSLLQKSGDLFDRGLRHQCGSSFVQFVVMGLENLKNPSFLNLEQTSLVQAPFCDFNGQLPRKVCVPAQQPVNQVIYSDGTAAGY